jgi:hypothetical protein
MASCSSSTSQQPTYVASDHLRIRSGVLDPKIGANKNTVVTLTVNTREIDVFNVTDEDLKYLDSVTETAYYSHKNEKVTDVSVRNSKYTKTFDLNLDLRILTKQMAIGKMLVKPYKLNLYTEGSFFAAHRDTDRPGLMGTLILILPTTYTGGEISFGDFNLEATMPKDKLRFIYFDAGLEHSISTVESGYRITLVYNVLNPSSKSLIKSNVRFTVVPQQIYQDLLREAIEFCDDKQNILFGQHKYRNDIFYKLLEDLKKKFPVKDVAVEKDKHAYCPTKPSDILHVVTVYEINEPYEDDFQDEYDSEERDLESLAVETYVVEHVLFPLASDLKEHSIQMWRTTGYEGNSPEQTEYQLECYTAFLINPSNEKSSTEESPEMKKKRR